MAGPDFLVVHANQHRCTREPLLRQSVPQRNA